MLLESSPLSAMPRKTKPHLKPKSRPEFLEKNPHLREFLPFLDESNRESPRGAVIISCSYIDEQLRRILLAYLLENPESLKLLEGYNAPLGTFSARTTAAYSLGLISQTEHDECVICRKIRNEIAHSVRASFKDQKIIDLCKNLAFSAKDYGDVVVDPLGQFNTAATALILKLTNRAHYVKKHRVTVRAWPY